MKKILVILSVVCLFGSCNTHPFVIADGEKGEKDDREGGLSPLLDRQNHYAPDLKVLNVVDTDGAVAAIGGMEQDVVVLQMAQVEEPDDELVVDESDDEISMLRFLCLVDDGDVAWMDALFDHLISIHTAVECG